MTATKRFGTRVAGLLLCGLLAGAVMAADARVSLTVLDRSGVALKGGLFVFSRSDDPTVQFSVGEADDGSYVGSVTAGAGSEWQLTQVLVDGYLPVEVTLSSTAGGESLQQVEGMALNPGVPVPPLKIADGGTVAMTLTLDRRDEVMRAFMEARKQARQQAEEEAAAAMKQGTGLGEAYDTALTLYNAGDVEGSLPHFEKAATENPENLDVLRTHANVLYKLKQFEAFETAAGSVLRLDPGNREVLMMVYSGQRTRGDLRGALASLLTIKEAGGVPELAQHLNFIARSLPQDAKAIPAYEAMLELEPANPGACTIVAWLYAKGGDAANSSRWLDRAVALAPAEASTTYFDMAGRLLSLAESRPAELGRVVELLNRTIELEPGHAGAYRRLGLALWKQQDLDGAKTAFKRYLELQPDADDRDTIMDYLLRLNEE